MTPAAGSVQTSPFLFFTAFGAVFLAYWLVLVDGRPALPALRIRHVLLLGLAARLCLLPMTPSDDMARYVWEGTVAGEGFNPYRYAPDHGDLAALRDVSWRSINHPDIPALYPPLAQGLFLLLAAIRPSIWLFKGAFLLLDLLGAWVLIRTLRSPPGGPAGSEPDEAGAARITALYFLNPLLILETAGHGHYESLPLLFSLAFLWALKGDRPKAAAACLFLGAAGKIAALSLLPVLLLRFGWRRGLPLVLAVTAALAGLLAACGAWGTLVRFGTGFHYNDALPFLLRAALGRFLPAPAVGALALGLLALCVPVLMRLLRDSTPERQALGFMGLLLAFSPTLHPWYALWVLPFAAAARSRPWLLFTGTVAASYGVYARAHVTGRWREIPWLRIPEFVPPLLAWALEKAKGCKREFSNEK